MNELKKRAVKAARVRKFYSFQECPDGDKVMLITSNEVIRISHEAPEIIGQWASLADFFSEVIS